MVIRLQQLWFHAGILLISSIFAFGLWHLVLRTSEVGLSLGQESVNCAKLVTQLREQASVTYSQQLRSRLGRLENLPVGLNERAIESFSRREPLTVAGTERVVLSGGQRFLQRDTTAASNAIQFACNKKLPPENFAVTALLAAMSRDLTVAAFDAAANDADLIRAKLHTSILDASASTDLRDGKVRQSDVKVKQSGDKRGSGSKGQSTTKKKKFRSA